MIALPTLTVSDIRNIFKEKYKANDFVVDKTGCKLIEIVGVSYIVDDEVIFGKLDVNYAKKELEWYLDQSLNVYDMPKPPTIWKAVADKDGYVNSNYGWCIFSKDNDEQYRHCLRELRKNKDTRRAMMIYTRPSMQEDYNVNGMSDFICTNNVQVLIRDDTLIYIINQRSCDAIYGFKNDIYWHSNVVSFLIEDLKPDYNIDKSIMIHQVGSLHVYEKHFKFLEDNVNV